MTLAIVHGHEVDALFAEHGLIVELDGWEYHADRVAFANDRERDAFMLDHGLVTVRITWERLHEAGEREAGRLQRILARRERELAALRAATQLSSPRAIAMHASHRGHGGFHG